MGASTASAQTLAQIQAQNAINMLIGQSQYTQFGNALGQGANASYALGTNYRFTLPYASTFIDYVRIWIIGCTVSNSNATTAGALNRNGFYQLLGSLKLSLGNKIYEVPGGALPLLLQTYSARGDLASFRGDQTYGFSSDLFAVPSSVAASGSSVYTGYIDIPGAVLRSIFNSEGMIPTLSTSGLTLEFTTPAALQGADCMVNPFGTAGTLALSGTSPGTVSVWGHFNRQLSVVNNGALPPFIVGPAFTYQDVTTQFYQAKTFYPFQGQMAEETLVKCIMVIDSPGELANEYSDPGNLVSLRLMYDQNTPVYEATTSQTPYFNGTTGGLANWMVDQGQAIGDQPPGVYVFDFGRGTDPKYPNSSGYANLKQFKNMGVELQYAVAPQAGSLIHFLNQYAVPNFYQGITG